MRLVSTIIVVTTASVLPQFALAENAEHGRRLAENWCASCHEVSAGPHSAEARAPSFAAIAQSPDFNAERLSYLLLDPHPKMAKLALSRKAINDIAAYILSLKK